MVPRPRYRIADRLCHDNGLGSSQFARRYYGSCMLLSFPRGNEMFQFPRFPPTALCVQAEVTGHDPSRVSPFGYPRIKAWSAAPRGLSQPPTSFIGIWRQGIHRWLFVAWNLQDARARYAVLKELGAKEALGLGEVMCTLRRRTQRRRPRRPLLQNGI